MENIVRIGVIGVGNMGHAHARYLADGNVRHAELTALCDINELRRNELKDLFPNVPVFEDAEQLFSAGICDAVIIATPHYDHPKIGVRAFECGLHVVSEKPMSVQFSAARAFAEAADRSGKTFCVMFNQRTNPIFKKARELIQSGEIGVPKRLNWIITNWYRTQNYYDSGAWRATWSGEGGGVLMNQAPHNLDLLQWIFGMPARVRAFCSLGKYHNIEVEDEALIYGEYDNGATAVFHTSTGEYPGTNRLEITGDRGKMVLENGVLKFWRLECPEREFCFNSDASFAKIPMEYQEMTFSAVKKAHGVVLQNFVDHILFDEELLSDGREALNEVALCNAAYLSSWQDRWVAFPFDEGTFDEELKKLQASSFHRESVGKAENSEYQERWQVRW